MVQESQQTSELRVDRKKQTQFIELVIDRHSSALRAYLSRKISGYPLEVEDLLQKVWLKFTEVIYSGKIIFPDDLDARKWLFTVAHNLMANYYRDKRATSLELDDGHATKEPGPEAVAIRNESIEELKRLIGTLPKDYQKIVGLHHLQDNLTLTKVAELLGTTESAIKSKQARAFKKLREKLAEK